MAAIDIDLSSVATEMLTSDSGIGYIKLIRQSGSVYDGRTGTTIPGTIEQIPLAAAAVDIPDSLYDGTRIKKGDVMIVADNQVKPLMTDRLLIGSSEYAITALPVAGDGHNGIPQVYKVVGRK